MECDKWNLFVLAPGNKIWLWLTTLLDEKIELGHTLVGLCKEEISLFGGRKIRDTITGVEHGRSVREGRVSANLDGLVMAVNAVVKVGQ